MCLLCFHAVTGQALVGEVESPQHPLQQSGKIVWGGTGEWGVQEYEGDEGEAQRIDREDAQILAATEGRGRRCDAP